MLNEHDLQELIHFQVDAPVLSVYLNVDPAAGSADRYKLRLRQMLKPFEEEAPQDCEAIRRFIDHEYDWSGRGLAIFSCAAQGFFRSYPLALPVRSRARLTNRPYVKPLADLLDNYGHYGVALVDKQGARLFHFHLGWLQEQQGTMGEAVRHTKHGGGSQAAGRRGGVAGQTRHAEEVAERNMKEAASFAARFFQQQKIRRVLVGGTEANVARFLAHLPKSWRSLVVGTFAMDMNASHDQVLEKAIEVASEAEVKKERRLVEAMITAAAKGQDGVVGLDDTLAALHAGRIQTLIVSEGFRQAGYRCTSCGFLTSYQRQQCPFCGSSFEEIPDAVDLAVRHVMRDGGEVEIIRQNASLERAGHIGAILRY
jgi:peptide subunit release factor 1 (eRF1)